MAFPYTRTPFPHYYARVISRDCEEQKGWGARVKYYCRGGGRGGGGGGGGQGEKTSDDGMRNKEQHEGKGRVVMRSVRQTVERRFESYMGAVFSAMKAEYVVVAEQAHPLGPAYSFPSLYHFYGKGEA